MELLFVIIKIRNLSINGSPWQIQMVLLWLLVVMVLQRDHIKRVKHMTSRPIHGMKLLIIHILCKYTFTYVKILLFETLIQYSAFTAMLRSQQAKVQSLSGVETMLLFTTALDGVDSMTCIRLEHGTVQSSMMIRFTSLGDLEHCKHREC